MFKTSSWHQATLYFALTPLLLSPAFLPAAPAIESSRDLNGQPQVIDRGGSERISLKTNSRGKLTLGTPEIAERDGLHTIRIPLKSASDIPLKVEVRTCFIKTDGSVVRNPYTAVKGGFEGMARGFVGVVSMGASEVALENEEEQKTTILTNHHLKPGKEIIVEHQLPFACSEVVGSWSEVGVVASIAEENHEREVRKMLQERYWEARQRYNSEKQEETSRWNQLRRHLESERKSLPSFSKGYKAALEAYWSAHKHHQQTLENLEARFNLFAVEQRELLQSELGLGLTH